MKKFFVVVLAGLLTSCASGPKSKISSNNTDSLKGKKSVYIGQYAVTFITEDKGSASASSPMFSDESVSAKSTIIAKLKGVPDNVFEAIATKAYNDFVADLTAKGYEIRDISELKKNSKWQDLSPLKTPYKPSTLSSASGFLRGEKREFATYSATPLQLYAAPDNPGSTVVIPSGVGSAAEAVETPIFMVNHVVHFAYFDTDTDYSINYASPTRDGTATAEVALGQGIQVTAGSTAQFIVDGGGSFSDSGSVSISEPIVVGGAYGKNKNTTSGARKAANVFSSTLGMFSGSSSSSEEFSVVANPKYFEAGALKALDEANNRMVNGLTP